MHTVLHTIEVKEDANSFSISTVIFEFVNIICSTQ